MSKYHRLRAGQANERSMDRVMDTRSATARSIPVVIIIDVIRFCYLLFHHFFLDIHHTSVWRYDYPWLTKWTRILIFPNQPVGTFFQHERQPHRSRICILLHLPYVRTYSCVRTYFTYLRAWCTYTQYELSRKHGTIHSSAMIQPSSKMKHHTWQQPLLFFHKIMQPLLILMRNFHLPLY